MLDLRWNNKKNTSASIVVSLLSIGIYKLCIPIYIPKTMYGMFIYTLECFSRGDNVDISYMECQGMVF